jgi:hypothetical protein
MLPPMAARDSKRRRMRTTRRHLAQVVNAAIVPYGYTLTVWSSGTLATERLGLPTLPSVLLFVAGAAVAFFLVGAIAHGSLDLHLVAPTAPRSMGAWGAAQLLPAGLAILAVEAAVQIITADAAWVVVGFLATSVYLVAAAAQLALADRASDPG